MSERRSLTSRRIRRRTSGGSERSVSGDEGDARARCASASCAEEEEGDASREEAAPIARSNRAGEGKNESARPGRALTRVRRPPCALRLSVSLAIFMRHWTSGRSGNDQNIQLPSKPPVRPPRSFISLRLFTHFKSFFRIDLLHCCPRDFTPLGESLSSSFLLDHLTPPSLSCLFQSCSKSHILIPLSLAVGIQQHASLLCGVQNQSRYSRPRRALYLL